jgi:PKHD-type hydroxylase|tara:strand:- start:73 stop:651 length:579 start_codon:yes stop_codon:yes gene_type:complete
MNYSWWNYPEKVEPDYIDDIITRCDKVPKFEGRVGAVRSDNTDLNKSLRNSKIAFLDRYEHQDIFNLMQNLAVQANNEAYGFDINTLELAQFTTYKGKDKGKYDWHNDIAWVSPNNMYHRKVSIIIQLSDPSNYEGGEFEMEDANFSEQDKIDLAKKGSVITFPSFINHRVKPVTKGTRMSLVGWMLGPKFK